MMLKRRDLIIGSLLCTATLNASYTSPSQPGVNSTRKLKLYDQLNFRNRPKLDGLSDISVYYADQLWPDQKKGENPDIAYIREKYRNKPLRGVDNILCIDIEHWPLRRVSRKTREASISKYILILDTFRTLYPDAKIGLFEFGPTAFYPLYDQFAFQNVDEKLNNAWLSEQEALAEIYASVDILFPQLYSRWESSPAAWVNCASIVLDKAKELALGRPVIPFIWPQFWTKEMSIIPGYYWKVILETLGSSVDAAVVWSIYKSAPAWSGRYDWWHITEDYLGRKIDRVER